ncbi:hypothetical protein DXG01_014881 [Tephrocybe rancida]|nr:hypothetical protein DXG01_014881 [Tephrocybe rancida]
MLTQTITVALAPRLYNPHLKAKIKCIPSDIILELESIFRDKALCKHLMRCQKKDAQLLLDSFQQLLDRTDLSSSFRKDLIVATQRLSSKAELAPTSYTLQEVTQVGEDPVASGAFADIYKGQYKGQAVCLKRMRIHKKAQIDHILKPNVLVDGAGRARLADFGISSVLDAAIVAWTSEQISSSKGRTARWRAPEVLQSAGSVPTNSKESDVYALGCVVLEIFTGELPFPEIVTDAVAHHIIMGGCPMRPDPSSSSWTDFGLTEEIWACVEPCWEREPSERPNANTVIRRLGGSITAADSRRIPEADMTSLSNFRGKMKEGFKMITVDMLKRLVSQGKEHDDAPSAEVEVAARVEQEQARECDSEKTGDVAPQSSVGGRTLSAKYVKVNPNSISINSLRESGDHNISYVFAVSQCFVDLIKLIRH